MALHEISPYLSGLLTKKSQYTRIQMCHTLLSSPKQAKHWQPLQTVMSSWWFIRPVTVRGSCCLYSEASKQRASYNMKQKGTSELTDWLALSQITQYPWCDQGWSVISCIFTEKRRRMADMESCYILPAGWGFTCDMVKDDALLMAEQIKRSLVRKAVETKNGSEIKDRPIYTHATTPLAEL